MAKVYEYKDKIYCEIDISEKDDRYDGDTYDLYWELRKDGSACETTTYYSPYNPENIYDNAEQLIEEEYEDYVVGKIDEE